MFAAASKSLIVFVILIGVGQLFDQACSSEARKNCTGDDKECDARKR